jgi:hypothetical protein
MKTLNKILAGIALGASLLLPNSTKAQETSFYGDLNVGPTYETPIIKKVDNMPLEIRAVPNENADIKAEPINDDDVEMYGRLSLLKGRCGAKFKLGDYLNFKAGIGLDVNFDAGGDNTDYSNRKDGATRNPDEDATGGTSKALVGKLKSPIFKCSEAELEQSKPKKDSNTDYYCVYTSYYSKDNTAFRPSLFSEIEFKLGEDKTLALGYEIFQQNINAETGWSGSGEKSQLETHNLASLTIGRPYAAYRYTWDNADIGRLYLGLEGGLNQVIGKKFTEKGSKADFEFNETAFFAGFKAGIEF